MKSENNDELELAHGVICLVLQLMSFGYALTASWNYKHGDNAGAAFDLGFAILVAIWARK